jgi:hypothetical protein
VKVFVHPEHDSFEAIATLFFSAVVHWRWSHGGGLGRGEIDLGVAQGLTGSMVALPPLPGRPALTTAVSSARARRGEPASSTLAGVAIGDRWVVRMVYPGAGSRSNE